VVGKGSQPPQLLASGEVAMTDAYNGRIAAANDKDKKNFKIVWTNNLYTIDSWVIMKGTPNKAQAESFSCSSTIRRTRRTCRRRSLRPTTQGLDGADRQERAAEPRYRAAEHPRRLSSTTSSGSRTSTSSTSASTPGSPSRPLRRREERRCCYAALRRLHAALASARIRRPACAARCGAAGAASSARGGAGAAALPFSSACFVAADRRDAVARRRRHRHRAHPSRVTAALKHWDGATCSRRAPTRR
jgi:hypothetical protein